MDEARGGLFGYAKIGVLDDGLDCPAERTLRIRLAASLATHRRPRTIALA